MQATRPLLILALLLGGLPGGDALAEYPFEAMNDGYADVPPAWSPHPQYGSPGRRPATARSRPFGSRSPGGLLSRGLFRNVSQSRGASALVDGPNMGGPPPDRHAPPMLPYDTLDGTLPYDSMSYESMPYGAGPQGGDPYGGGAYGGDPYAGDPYGSDAYGGGRYGDVIDEFAPAGGPGYGGPSLQDDLFGFDAAIWPGFIAGNLMPGTDRFLFGGEWFQPLYQDGRTLWYFNFRGQGDDNSASEFNTGTGVRVLTDPGWIFGGYVYWDHLRSRFANNFNQGMIGFEAMSVLWDARMNVYFPESGPKSAGPAIAAISGGNLVVNSGFERAYWGMDFEVGHLFWAAGPAAQHEIRGFAAIYHFDHSAAGTDSITGPRVRGEYRWYDLPYFGPGSRFTFGLTLQADEERDAQLFAFANLRIPLDPWAHARRPLSPLHRRMLDSVVRDVDIVTSTTRQSERALNPLTGREIRGYARIDAATQNAHDLLENLDTDSVIVLDGSKGVIHAPGSGYQLKTGQTVIGADTTFEVVGAGSGRVATFDPGGQRPTLDFGQTHTTGYAVAAAADGDAVGAGVWMNDNTQLVGIDIQNAPVGVNVHDADNVLIHDVEISEYTFAGVSIRNSTDVRLHDVRVRDAWTSGPQGTPHAPINPDDGQGIIVRNSADVAIEDSLVDDAAHHGIDIGASHDIVIRGTTVRDTRRDSIHLSETSNVLIENTSVKNTATGTPLNMMGGVFTHELAGISLHDTTNTIIKDSQIHHSKGPGILGIAADNTLLSGLDIAHTEHGVAFDESHNVALVGSRILLPDEAFRNYVPPTEGVSLMITGWVPQHSGVTYRNVTGEAVVAENEILGGVAGGGVVFGAGSGSTTLRIRDNLIDRIGESGVVIASTVDHTLTANIFGNTVHSDEVAFFLQASGNGTRQVTVKDNEWDGEFRTRLMGGVLDLDIDANHMGGNPMGGILGDAGTNLQLRYVGNTSTPGAQIIEFSTAGTVSATINNNDHTPFIQAP